MNMNSEILQPKGVRFKLTPFVGKELPNQFWINAVLMDKSGITIDHLSAAVRQSVLMDLQTMIDDFTSRGIQLSGTTIQRLRRLTKEHPVDFYGHVHGLIT